MQLKTFNRAALVLLLSLAGCEQAEDVLDLSVKGDLARVDLAGADLTDVDLAGFVGGDGFSPLSPRVVSTNPVDGASNLCIPAGIEATFDRQMDPLTMVAANFLVTAPGPTQVNGMVAYDFPTRTAIFKPQSPLLGSTTYTATVTTGARDPAGNPLATSKVWMFTTNTNPCVQPINLRGIATYGIASRAGLTSTGVTVVNGDVALYPNPACTDATGGPAGSARVGGCAVHTLPPSATGLTVNGSIFYFGDPFDNGGTANSVVNDLNIAWSEGASRVPTQPLVAASELGGKTLVPGVYHNANLGLMAGGVVVMDAQNDPNAEFIFQVDTDLTDSGTLLLPSRIDLSNGAQAKNIWFVVGRDITIGHGTKWNGTILAGRTATINDGSTINGRVLAGADKSLPTGALTLVGAAAPSVTTITLP